MTSAPVHTAGITATLDGPAGAGKSTIARLAAKQLGYTYLNTGAIYRCLAWLCLQRGAALDDEPAVVALASELAAGFHFGQGAAADRVFVGNTDVTEAIRDQDVGRGASRVSGYGGVRGALLETQRAVARSANVIADGRDTGTVVFPGARFKFFVTARPEIRAQRRYDELAAKGVRASFPEILAEISERDEQDRRRAIAPLRPAPGAQLVDTSEMSVESAVAHVVNTIKSGLAKGESA